MQVCIPVGYNAGSMQGGRSQRVKSFKKGPPICECAALRPSLLRGHLYAYWRHQGVKVVFILSTCTLAHPLQWSVVRSRNHCIHGPLWTVGVSWSLWPILAIKWLQLGMHQYHLLFFRTHQYLPAVLCTLQLFVIEQSIKKLFTNGIFIF